jgi:hypothetical protein
MSFLIRKIVIASTVILINQIIVAVSLGATLSQAYNPMPLATGKEIKDTLTKSDFPTGEGGFARDYIVNLRAGDQILIDVKSSSFDTVATLIAARGVTIGENDDAVEGTTNSLLFARIAKDGNYIVRIRSFGSEPSEGAFTLKLTRLRPE